MRTLLFLVTLFSVATLSVGTAAASHIQHISHDSAEAFCAGHGGGTDCNFCHSDHCHSIQCTKDGCTNLVWTAAKRDGPTKSDLGTATSGKSNTKTGNNPPPKTNNADYR